METNANLCEILWEITPKVLFSQIPLQSGISILLYLVPFSKKFLLKITAI